MSIMFDLFPSNSPILDFWVSNNETTSPNNLSSFCQLVFAGILDCVLSSQYLNEFSSLSLLCASKEPGHDAWVVGDKQAVAYEFHGAWGDKH